MHDAVVEVIQVSKMFLFEHREEKKEVNTDKDRVRSP